MLALQPRGQAPRNRGVPTIPLQQLRPDSGSHDGTGTADYNVPYRFGSCAVRRGTLPVLDPPVRQAAGLA
jgi:hypothetical protein